MIRFVKNILDIKNILGMQRVVPPIPPTPLANPQISITHCGLAQIAVVFTTGELIVQYTQGGELVEERYGTDHSGQTITINCDTDETLNISNTESNLTIDDLQVISAQYFYTMVVRRYVTQIQITVKAKTLNVENAINLNSIVSIDPQFGVFDLYAIADTTSQRDASIAVMTNNANVPSFCNLYIDPFTAYATDVINAATSQGWTVHS